MTSLPVLSEIYSSAISIQFEAYLLVSSGAEITIGRVMVEVNYAEFLPCNIAKILKFI